MYQWGKQYGVRSQAVVDDATMVEVRQSPKNLPGQFTQ